MLGMAWLSPFACKGIVHQCRAGMMFDMWLATNMFVSIFAAAMMLEAIMLVAIMLGYHWHLNA